MEIFKLLGTLALQGTESFNKGLENASENGEKTEGRLSSSLKKIAIAVGTAFAAKKVADFGKQLVANSSAAADTIDKMSQKIGVSRKAYQELDFICSQSGTSVDNLQAGMKTLVSVMDGAASGTAESAEIFAKLGVSAVDANGNLRSSEDVMWETMSALQGMENQTEKARLATQLFGRSGTDLMPLLNGASGSIEAMKEQANELGLVMGDDAVNAGVAYTDALDQMNRSVTAVKNKLGAALLPILTKLFGKLAPVINKIMPKLIEATEKIFTSLEPVADILIDKLVGAIEWIADNTDQIIPILTAVAVAIGAIMISLNPIPTAIAAAVAAIALIATNWGKIKEWFGENIIEPIKKAWDSIVSWFDHNIIQPIEAAWAAITAWFYAYIIMPIKLAWQTIVSWFDLNIIQPIKDAWGTIVAWFDANIITPIKDAWKKITTWFDLNIIQPIKDAWATIATWFDANVVAPIKNAWATIVSWFDENIIQPINNLWNGIIANIQNAIDKAKTLLGFNGKSIVENATDGYQAMKDMEKQGTSPSDVFSRINALTANAKGAVFSKPTIFDTRLGGQMVGEAGAEAVAPISVLQGYVGDAVRNAMGAGGNAVLESAINKLTDMMRQVVENTGAGNNIVLDSGVLVGQIAPKIDTALGDMSNRGRRY